MSLYTLRTTDTLPALQTPDKLRIEECIDVALLSWMSGGTREEVIRRIANDNAAYVAYLDEQPAAFGWIARGKAFIGELAHDLILPSGHRYLWNFRTMEEFRGLGIYPVLLQYIICTELKKASQFWIIHAPENISSLKGITKAGFQYVGRLYTNEGQATIEKTVFSRANRKVLAEMDISISANEAASCWNCTSPYLKNRKEECCCAVSLKECVGPKKRIGFPLKLSACVAVFVIYAMVQINQGISALVKTPAVPKIIKMETAILSKTLRRVWPK